MTVEAVIMAEPEVALPEGQVLFVTPLMDMSEPAEPNLPAETQELHAILQPVVHSVKAVMHTTALVGLAVVVSGATVGRVLLLKVWGLAEVATRLVVQVVAQITKMGRPTPEAVAVVELVARRAEVVTAVQVS